MKNSMFFPIFISFEERQERLFRKSEWTTNSFLIQLIILAFLVHIVYFVVFSIVSVDYTTSFGYGIDFGLFIPVTLVLFVLSVFSPLSTTLTRHLWYFFLGVNSVMIAFAISLKTILCSYSLQPFFVCSTVNRPLSQIFYLYAVMGPVLTLSIFRISRRYQLFFCTCLLIVFSWVITITNPTITGYFSIIFLIGAHLMGFLISRSYEVASRSSFQKDFRINQEIKERISTEQKLIIEVQSRRKTAFSLERQIVETKRARENEKVADSRRTQFTSYIFHEIRVPLNAISLSWELLNSDEKLSLDSSQRELITRVKKGLDSIETILNDTLDFRKMSDGKLLIIMAPFDFHSMIKSLLWAMGDSFKDKLLVVEQDLDPVIENLAYLLINDEGRIRQVIANYLSNACKFSKTGGKIIISTKMVGTDRLRVQITDFGNGVSLPDQEKLFQPFVQINNSGLLAQGKGTGLGLSICAHIIRQVHGSFGMSSGGHDLGSTFWFETPFVLSTVLKSSQKTKKLPTIKPTGFSLNILVTDDDIVTRNVMKRILTKMGHLVDVAVDGKDCIEKTKLKTYDLLFMDNIMPNISGLEAIGILRESGFTTPIVSITGSAQLDVQEQLIRMGANLVLVKPVGISILEKTILQIPTP